MIFTGGVLIAVGLLVSSAMPVLWPLFITYGVVIAVGASICFIPSVGVVGQWFHKYRGVATGIAVAGSGIGNLVFPPLATVVIQTMGWRAAMRIIACFTVMVCVAAFLEKRRVVAPTKRENLVKVLFAQKSFRLLFITALFAGYGYLVPFAHIAAFAVDEGVSPVLASILLALLGASSTIGRVVMGILADKFGRILIFRITLAVMAVTTFAWPFLVWFPAMAVYAIIFGMVGGGFVSMVPAVAADYFGVEKLVSIVGILYAAAGVGFLLGPPITGLLFDMHGSYVVGGMIAAATLVVSFIVSLFYPKVEKQNEVELPKLENRPVKDVEESPAQDVAIYEDKTEDKPTGYVFYP